MAKSRNLILAEYLLFRAVLLPVRLLPRRAWRLAGNFLAAIAWALIGSARRTALDNLDLAFGASVSPVQKRCIARRSFDELGLTAVELANWHRVTGAQLLRLTDSPNGAGFQESLAKGKGLVVCCPHYSNWEWMAGYVASLGYPLNAVIRPLDNPLLDAHLSAARRSKKVRILARKTSVRPVMEALRRNEIVGLMADQNAAVGGAFIPFFGLEASTMRGPVYFAAACGSPVRVAWERRTAGGRHELFLSEEIPLTGDERRDLAAIHGRFEELIRRDPAPWMWVHPRWRKRPPGESGFYPGTWT
ncbi:MAG: hypothetical protein J0L75_02045 [Spirochaetes bacterium]|nr:hypothetical protein [Spirochaetota bacterium]